MIGFYFAFLAVLLTGLAARDQLQIAGLSQRQGQRPGVLIVALAVAIASAALAAWLGTIVAPLLGPEARGFLAGLALLLGGAESLLLSPRRAPEEPTHSLVALAIVLASHQLTDAARFAIFGIAVGTNAPVPVALGGAIGGMVLVFAGWAAPGIIANPRLRLARRIIGVVLILVGLYVGFSSIGKL